MRYLLTQTSENCSLSLYMMLLGFRDPRWAYIFAGGKASVTSEAGEHGGHWEQVWPLSGKEAWEFSSWPAEKCVVSHRHSRACILWGHTDMAGVG